MKRSLPVSPNDIYFFGLTVLAIGLPFSNFLMSISQLFLGAAWLLAGNYKERLKSFWSNKPAVVLASVFLMHILGITYTTDFNYGLEDLRKKIPLFVLPFIISTMDPFSKKRFDWLMAVFVLSVSFFTFWGTAKLFGWVGETMSDSRQLSTKISHIRFALMICMSIFILLYFAYKHNSLVKKIFFTAAAGWLLYFLTLMEAMTGLVIMMVVIFLFLLYKIVVSKKIILKLAFGVALIILSVSLFNYIAGIAKEYYSVKEINPLTVELKTLNGNAYTHDFSNLQIENGNYVGLYVCRSELSEEWNKRSKIKFDSVDKSGYRIDFTILRYLSSKGLRKDSAGVSQLSDNDISAIEAGIPNFNYGDISSVSNRIHQIGWELYEYVKRNDPRGHSVTQRFEFWRAACGIIGDNPIIGVGTGDAKIAYKEQYSKINSLLEEKSRMRAHNQYLAIGVAFGISGMIWFLFSLLYPIIKNKKTSDFLYVTFFLIAILSMMNEDTLETQAGVTFYAFFNSLLLLGREKSGC